MYTRKENVHTVTNYFDYNNFFVQRKNINYY
jgi:hypothetical protein